MTRSLRVRIALPAAILVALVAIACTDPATAPTSGDVTPPESSVNVWVVSEDDLILNGRLFGKDNDTLVVLTHMRRGDQSAWFAFAEELADNGFAAFTFDFRGFGESDGGQDFDTLDDDLRAVLRYLRATRDEEAIFLVGASMGGTASLVVAAEEQLDGVVSVSAPDEFEGQSAIGAAPSISEPKLFLAAQDDAAARLSLDALRDAASEPKDWHLFEGNDHGTDLLAGEQSAEFRRRILDFLREHAGS